MRQVEYVGFDWKNVELDHTHIIQKTPWETKINPEILSWLAKNQSGGYYYIQTYNDPARKISEVKTIYFSNPHDAMMFKLTWG